MNCDPKTLLQAARCFCFLPRTEYNGALIYTLCAWANASGEALDPDVQAFVDASGITDASQIDALSGLVSDLKTLPVVGTKYWKRQLLLYPFVGEASGPHSYNLIDPSLYQLTYHGTPVPAHSATGMKGSGIVAGSGYANTHWRCPVANQDDVCVMIYAQALATTGGARMACGGADVNSFSVRVDDTALAPFRYDLNNAPISVTPANGADVLGALFCQRTSSGGGTSMNAAYLDLVWSNSNVLRTAVPAADVFLLANNSGPVSSWSDMEISGFNVLSQLTDTERLEYKDIWDDFEEALGRGHRLGV